MLNVRFSFVHVQFLKEIQSVDVRIKNNFDKSKFQSIQESIELITLRSAEFKKESSKWKEVVFLKLMTPICDPYWRNQLDSFEEIQKKTDNWSWARNSKVWIIIALKHERN